MSRDVEGEAAYLSALKAFRSRTAYANSGGDHLVGVFDAPLWWIRSEGSHRRGIPDVITPPPTLAAITQWVYCGAWC